MALTAGGRQALVHMTLERIAFSVVYLRTEGHVVALEPAPATKPPKTPDAEERP